MPAVGIVVGFLFEATGITAAVSTAISGILGAGMVADIATGAIIGAGEGAVSAAIQGGDIAKGALMGAVGGGVGAGASDVVKNVMGIGEPLAGTIGPTRETGFQGAIQGGVSRLAGGLASGLAGGRSFDQALRGAIPGALGGAVTGAAQYGFGVDPRTSGELGGLASSALQTVMTPQPKFNISQPSQPATTARPSASLGQSLSIAPSLGYTPGMTVFGSEGKDDKSKPRVWNVASLRNVGEAEA